MPIIIIIIIMYFTVVNHARSLKKRKKIEQCASCFGARNNSLPDENMHGDL